MSLLTSWPFLPAPTLTQDIDLYINTFEISWPRAQHIYTGVTVLISLTSWPFLWYHLLVLTSALLMLWIYLEVKLSVWAGLLASCVFFFFFFWFFVLFCFFFLHVSSVFLTLFLSVNVELTQIALPKTALQLLKWSKYDPEKFQVICSYRELTSASARCQGSTQLNL